MPPGALVAGVVKLPMMGAAEVDGELVADFAPERFRLGKADVVGIGGEGATDKAWLRGDVAEVRFVAKAAWLSEGQGALVDGSRSSVARTRGQGERISNRDAAAA